jgi:hypothetical protein
MKNTKTKFTFFTLLRGAIAAFIFLWRRRKTIEKLPVTDEVLTTAMRLLGEMDELPDIADSDYARQITRMRDMKTEEWLEVMLADLESIHTMEVIYRANKSFRVVRYPTKTGRRFKNRQAGTEFIYPIDRRKLNTRSMGKPTLGLSPPVMA